MFDAFVDFVQLVQNLFDFETGQLTKAVGHDGTGLRVVEAELVHDGLLGFRRAALTGTDGGDDFVDDVDGAGQTFQDMGAVFGFLQLEAGAAQDDFVTVGHKMLNQLLEVQGIGTTVDQSHIVHVERALERGHQIQLVQHHVGVGITFQLIHHADTFSV